MYNYLTLTRIAGGFLFRSAHISVGKYSLDLNRLKPIKRSALAYKQERYVKIIECRHQTPKLISSNSISVYSLLLFLAYV